MAAGIGARPGDRHAVTMTAELSQLFRTKREGVAFILDQLSGVFLGEELHIYSVEGAFLTVDAAKADPLRVAASNWAATARWIGQSVSDAIVIDVGSTTTDLTPIIGGSLAAGGRTDPARLRECELIYTGALRTPVEALTAEVPLWGGVAGVSTEGFATIGDVHLWRGALAPSDYTAPTPDGRPATHEFAGERLARAVCGDRDLLGASDIDAIAEAFAEAQLARIVLALRRLCTRHAELQVAVTLGLGDFIAAEAARRCDLRVIPLAERVGTAAARVAPALAVASLLNHA